MEVVDEDDVERVKELHPLVACRMERAQRREDDAIVVL